MKERQIRVWPEMVHYLPSVSPLQALAGHDNDIRIDFAACKEITSTGLTVFLLRLLKLLHVGRPQRTWRTQNLDDNPAFKAALELGFFHHLNSYCTNDSLILAPETNKSGPFYATEHNLCYGRKVTSFPIIRLDFNRYKSDRRQAMKAFKDELLKYLNLIKDSCYIHVNQLASIFLEMAKNSADHTKEDAFFGMDAFHIPEKNSVELHFVLGDLGNGIKQHIQDHLPPDLKTKRDSHWSLYESYYFALKQGYTSSPEKPKNRGLGMTIILKGAQGIDMSLSVFDAYSRGILTSLKDTTHEELRRHFIAFSKDKVFYYYGSLEGSIS